MFGALRAAPRRAGRALCSPSAPAALRYNAPALERLAADAERGGGGPLLLVDSSKIRSAEAWAEHVAQECDGLVKRTLLQPHAQSVLLGDPATHSFDAIVLSEWACAATAFASLTEPSNVALRAAATQPGSWLAMGRRSAQFGGMATLEGDGPAPIDASPPRPVLEACPFVRDPSGTSQPAAWEALLDDPSDRMYAMNYIRRPAAKEAYGAYGAHFAHLPDRYGLRFAEVAELHPQLLLGPEDAAHDLLALVYFPSSACFAKAWSDEAIARDAFPLREALVRDGFEHVWLRCSEG